MLTITLTLDDQGRLGSPSPTDPAVYDWLTRYGKRIMCSLEPANAEPGPPTEFVVFLPRPI